VENKRFQWKRFGGNPVFPTVPGTWMERHTANPDLLRIGETYFMYFRGQQGGHDRIGLATIAVDEFDGKTWRIRSKPVIDVGKPGDWDETHVLDPASVTVNGKVYLYYSAVSTFCNRAVCLATSPDGVNFEKYAANPVAIGGAPEIVHREGMFYLYYSKQRENGRGFQVRLATSCDGYRFKEPLYEPVLPAGPKGSWDSHAIVTPRIFREGELYYMMYCGSDRYDDYPWYAGLATSHDLVQWEKYKHNPVFSRGEEGEWDEGAIWFTTVEKIGGTYYLWYEGFGGANARTEQYPEEGRSQIGMATLRAGYLYVKP